MGDRWGGGFHSDAWRRNGITYNACEQTTSENYLAALPLLLSGRARLLDDAVLQKELTGLERRVHANGRESVSHAAAASAHDDVAAAVCGALVAASASTRSYDMLAWFDNNETLDLARQQQLAFNRYVAMRRLSMSIKIRGRDGKTREENDDYIVQDGEALLVPAEFMDARRHGPRRSRRSRRAATGFPNQRRRTRRTGRPRCLCRV